MTVTTVQRSLVCFDELFAFQVSLGKGFINRLKLVSMVDNVHI